MWSLVLSLLMMAAIFPTRQAACPGGCSCSSSAVDCSGEGLEKVPRGIPKETTTLYLGYNNFTSLPAGIFGNLRHILKLQMDHGRLTSLPPDVFGNLSQLLFLDLSSNELTSLPDGVFKDLGSIDTLYLNNNALTSLPAGIFNNNPVLEDVYLSSNRLTSLPEGVFKNFWKTWILDLSNNSLTSLPAGIFDNMPLLYILDLSSNPLVFKSCLCAVHMLINLDIPSWPFRHESYLEAAKLRGKCGLRSALCFVGQPHLFCPTNRNGLVYDGTKYIPAKICADDDITCLRTATCFAKHGSYYCNCPTSLPLWNGYCYPANFPKDFPIFDVQRNYSSIVIRWLTMTPAEINGDLVGYNIYFSVNPTSTFQKSFTTLNYFTIIDQNSNILIKMSVSNTAGEGPISAVRTILPETPTITNITATSFTMTIHWSSEAPKGTAGVAYEVRYYKVTESGHSNVVTIKVGGQTTYKATNLDPGTYYGFQVSQLGSNGYGDFSPAREEQTNYYWGPPVTQTPSSTPQIIGGSIGAGLCVMIGIGLVLCFYFRSRPVAVPPYLLPTLQTNTAYGMDARYRSLGSSEPVYEYLGECCTDQDARQELSQSRVIDEWEDSANHLPRFPAAGDPDNDGNLTVSGAFSLAVTDDGERTFPCDYLYVTDAPEERQGLSQPRAIIHTETTFSTNESPGDYLDVDDTSQGTHFPFSFPEVMPGTVRPQLSRQAISNSSRGPDQHDETNHGRHYQKETVGEEASVVVYSEASVVVYSDYLDLTDVCQPRKEPTNSDQDVYSESERYNRSMTNTQPTRITNYDDSRNLDLTDTAVETDQEVEEVGDHPILPCNSTDYLFVTDV